MKEIFFNPDGGALIAKAIFPPSAAAPASYELLLRESGSNITTSLLKGDNLNPQDDIVTLPIPVDQNNGRRIILETGFVGLDITHTPDYTIQLEIWQDGARLGFEQDNGAFTGKAQYSIIFIRLTAN
ncbi:hypothetical protein [Chitinophaga vietnamensis]|uniref:hypothetical protein n=1 Tax=Chitinophaga vietnamensis TaxID=2593957 RepID=UPI001178CD47|nr:hypothetical protein [Chitinophaga vietnamensis]